MSTYGDVTEFLVTVQNILANFRKKWRGGAVPPAPFNYTKDAAYLPARITQRMSCSTCISSSISCCCGNCVKSLVTPLLLSDTTRPRTGTCRRGASLSRAVAPLSLQSVYHSVLHVNSPTPTSVFLLCLSRSAQHTANFLFQPLRRYTQTRSFQFSFVLSSFVFS